MNAVVLIMVVKAAAGLMAQWAAKYGEYAEYLPAYVAHRMYTQMETGRLPKTICTALIGQQASRTRRPKQTGILRCEEESSKKRTKKRNGCSAVILLVVA